MMSKKVLFLQLEIFLDCAPHMGMCLFINDLQDAGIDFSAYLVNCNHMDDLMSIIDANDYGLICLDSSFTVDLVNELMERFPDIPVLVGGVNALALFLNTKIPFAVFGPGREAAGEFMAQFFGGQDYEKVPNLFFKTGNTIHYSGETRAWDLPSEILPYDPFMGWNYLGPRRKESANTEAVAIVAGTGCPHSKAVRTSTSYNLEESIRSQGYEITATAFQQLDKIFNQKTHGCSFCVFQLQEYTVYPVAQTTDLLLQQARYLSKICQTRAFCIQTENPFPFLNTFLDRLLEEKIPVEFVSIRTRPDYLLKQQTKLRKALDTASSHGFHFSIEEIGFESFDDKELVLFNKGVTADTNIKALECLRHMKSTYGEMVSVHVGHGIILFHPWTTVESMTKTLEVMAQFPEVFPRFYPNRLTLYSEFLPIFQKVSAEGLVTKADAGYGWDFSPASALTDKAFELYMVLYSVFGPDISIAQYLEAMRRIEQDSLEQILGEVFELVPDEE